MGWTGQAPRAGGEDGSRVPNAASTAEAGDMSWGMRQGRQSVAHVVVLYYANVRFILTARDRWISSFVGGADTEMFPPHSPHLDRLCREFRHHGQSQATALGLPEIFRRLLLEGLYRVRGKMFVPLDKVGIASRICNGNFGEVCHLRMTATLGRYHDARMLPGVQIVNFPAITPGDPICINSPTFQ